MWHSQESSCGCYQGFSRALATRLESRGVPHVVASRTPGKAQLSLQDGLREALVVLAVPAHAIYTLPLDKLPKDGVVVDCSNRTRRCAEDELSQAEQLAATLPPGPVVVKALNTVSGYFLEQVDDAEADLCADVAIINHHPCIPHPPGDRTERQASANSLRLRICQGEEI